MAYMTNREFAEHLFKQEKKNEYADALVKEVRRLREESAELMAERDTWKDAYGQVSGINGTIVTFCGLPVEDAARIVLERSGK